jgi:hypothetical protein
MPDQEEKRPEVGSYDAYRETSGHFVNSFLDCCHRADAHNLVRLKRAFPQMVAAFELWKNGHGDERPRGYPSDPFYHPDGYTS